MKSKHKYTKGLVGQFTLYPQKKKFKCTDWTENIEYVNVIISAEKKWLIQENQLAEKKYKNPLR